MAGRAGRTRRKEISLGEEDWAKANVSNETLILQPNGHPPLAPLPPLPAPPLLRQCVRAGCLVFEPRSHHVALGLVARRGLLCMQRDVVGAVARLFGAQPAQLLRVGQLPAQQRLLLCRPTLNGANPDRVEGGKEGDVGILR